MAYEASVVTQYSCRLSGDFPFVPFPYSLLDMYSNVVSTLIAHLYSPATTNANSFYNYVERLIYDVGYSAYDNLLVIGLHLLV